MAETRPSPESFGLASWRAGLQQPDMPPSARAFAEQLVEATDPYAVVVDLGLPLPYYRRFDTPGEFLADVDGGLQTFRDLGITNFYVGMRPTCEGLPKHRNDERPLRIDQVQPYISEHVTPDQYDSYSLRIAEYAVGVFGAIIIINPTGFQHVDIAFGDVGPLATGRKRPEYQARTDVLGVLRYMRVNPESRRNQSVDEDYLRQLRSHRVITEEVHAAIGGIIKRIPRIDPADESARAPRLPGRYEVVLVHRLNQETRGKDLVSVCVDAQPDVGDFHPYAIPEEPLYWGDGTRAN